MMINYPSRGSKEELRLQGDREQDKSRARDVRGETWVINYDWRGENPAETPFER